MNPANDLSSQFLQVNVRGNRDFDRVPHAQGFRTVAAGATGSVTDFILINVHLHYEHKGPKNTVAENAATRKAQVHKIKNWIDRHRRVCPERDHIIIGDFNFNSADEECLDGRPLLGLLKEKTVRGPASACTAAWRRRR